MNRVFLLTFLVLFGCVIGCDGRSYRLTLHTDRVPNWRSDQYQKVSSVIAEVALRNGYVEHPRSDSERWQGIRSKYVLEQQGIAKTGFSMLDEVSEYPKLSVRLAVFPSFDYPAAKTLRTELTTELTKLYGEHAVDGF